VYWRAIARDRSVPFIWAWRAGPAILFSVAVELLLLPGFGGLLLAPAVGA
jgi:hypothetical protein